MQNEIMFSYYFAVEIDNIEFLKDTSHREIKRWDFYRGWPCRWQVSKLHAKNNEAAVEMIEIAVE